MLIATSVAFIYSDRLMPHVYRLTDALRGEEPAGEPAPWVRACSGRRFFQSDTCANICVQQAQLSVREPKPAEQMQTRVSCHRCPHEWFRADRKKHTHTDPIWSRIHDHQSDEPWGAVLDAGTGSGSLRFITQLNTTRWSAVTASRNMHSTLTQSFGAYIRPDDELLLMNWDRADHPLKGRVFDVVLADYLLGAMDGFSPYRQDQIFEWLGQYVGKRLYFVGKEPIPDLNLPLNGTKSSGGQLFLDSERLRDACLLMAGERPYREYPSEWVLRTLERASFIVEGVWMFPIRYVGEAIDDQLRLCRNKLHKIRDPTLRSATLEAVKNLQHRVATDPEAKAGFCFGMDYVIAARPAGK